MRDDVGDPEPDEDVMFHPGHEVQTVRREDDDEGVPDADDAQDDQRQQHVLVLHDIR